MDDYARMAALGLLMLGFAGAPVAQAARGTTPPAAQETDAATRKLLAANGLFQRQLYKLAAEQYEAFLREHPTHRDAPTAQYALAVCQFRLGEHDKAVQGLQTALKTPGFRHAEEAMLVLAHAQMAQKRYPDALETLDDLLKRFPQADQQAPARVARAQVLSLMQRPANAAAAVEAFLKDYPESRYRWDALLLGGQALEAIGRADDAAAYFRKLTTPDSPRQAEAYLALGMLHYRQRQYGEAISALSKLTTDYPQSPHASPGRLQLALAQMAAGQLPAARKTLSEVIQRDPSRAAAGKYWLAQCDIAEKKYDAALKLLDELARLNPPPANLERVLLDRGQCLTALDRFDEARSRLEEFLQRYPETQFKAEATYRLAFSLHKLGRYDRSLGLLGGVQIAGDHPLSEPVAELRAENLFLLGRYGDAEKAFASLQAGASNTEQRLKYALRRGQSAYFSARYADAVELLRPVVDANPADEELARSAMLLGDALLQLNRPADAAPVLARYLPRAGKDKPEAQFKLALAQLRNNDPADAERNLDELMRSGGNSPWVIRATFEYGQLKYRQKDPVKAAEALRKVATANVPELSAPATYLLGWIDFDARRYTDAAGHFASIVSRYPKDALADDALFDQGAALKEAGREDKAIALFEQYLKSYPNSPQVARARQMIAACLVKLERHAPAVEALARLAGDPATTTDEVLYDLGWSQQALKHSAEAESAYRRLLSEYPNSRLLPSARSELAEILFQQEKYADAARLLTRVVSDPAADPKTVAVALYRLGACYEKLGDPAKAASTYQDFLKRHENDELAAWAHYQAGVNLLKQQKHAEAETHFRRALESNPKPELEAVALLKLGETRAQAQDFAGSQSVYEQFLRKYPKSPLAGQAQFGIGWAMENRRDYAAARQWYQKAVEGSNTPTAARAQFQIGETYFAEGNYEEAVKALLAVADVYAYPEWSARALLEAGRAFEQMKQPQQAKQQYEQLIQKYGSAPEAKLAEKRLKEL